jgi:hypothetical protein
MSSTLLTQENKPLFPNILWSRPLNRAQGGRILIIGGHSGKFSEVQALYQMALAAGAGECQIAMPDSLLKTLGPFGLGHFVASSPSGSLGKAALGELLMLAADYDAIIVAEDISNNSETAGMIETFIDKLGPKPLTISSELLDIYKFKPQKLCQRSRTLIVLDEMSLFKWANILEVPITKGGWDNMPQKLQVSQDVTKIGQANYSIYNGQLFVPDNNRSSTSVMPVSIKSLPAAVIAIMTVFWLQNPTQPFEALTTASYILQQATLEAEKPLTYSHLAKATTSVIDRDPE